MSYELEHIEKECPCPCGKGKIVYGRGTNDWNQVREGMTELWCPDCADKYKFTKGGLLPRDYPDYPGDKLLKVKIDNLHYVISNYCGSCGIRFWPKSLYESREKAYLTESERNESNPSTKRYYYSVAMDYAKALCKKYSKESLISAFKQLSNVRYSTELIGTAAEIAEQHKRRFGTIKPANVQYPVEVALRNYDKYHLAELEDKKYVSSLSEELANIESEYYQDYPAYEAELKKHLIQYELKEVR